MNEFVPISTAAKDLGVQASKQASPASQEQVRDLLNGVYVAI
jgi:hypothetical protein